MLSGILTIGAVVAVATTVAAAFMLDLSILGCLLVYSLSGAAATLFGAWRRFKCSQNEDMRATHAGPTVHRT